MNTRFDRPAPYVPTFLPDKSKFPETILPILSSILSELCKANDRCLPDKKQQKITKFHALAVPPISVADYLKRIAQYSEASDTCYILALVYLDRIQARPEFLVTSLNIHRLLITSVMVAAKFFDDTYYNNAYYARVGGIAKQEMNALELEFLFMIGFSLSVTSAEFQQYDNELRAHYARRQAALVPRAPAAVPAAVPAACGPALPQPAPARNGGYASASAPAPAFNAPQYHHHHHHHHHHHQPYPSSSRAFASFPNHSEFANPAVDFSYFSNGGGHDMDVENDHSRLSSASSSSAVPAPNGVAIRQPSQPPRSHQTQSSCSPSVSDFTEPVSSQQWVMIK